MKKLVKWLIRIIGVLLILGVLRLLFFTSCYIPNQGMENNLMQGDHIIINKLSYGFTNPFSGSKSNSSNPERGDIVLFNNPLKSLEEYAKDDIYISRCVGTPGDTLIVDSLFNILDTEGFFNPDQKDIYHYNIQNDEEIKTILTRLKINRTPTSLDSLTLGISLSAYELYLVEQELLDDTIIQPSGENIVSKSYPLIIPEKGKTLKVEPWNIVLLYNTILLHEGKDIQMKDNALWWNGKKILRYTFSKDYTWMTASNSVNHIDSRQFGFVPTDDLIGKASFVWFSKDPNKNLLHGYRWGRIFQSIY